VAVQYDQGVYTFDDQVEIDGVAGASAPAATAAR
jgi:hypothetical protein